MVVNEGAWGFYRVRYTPDLLDRLAAAGLQKICTPLERLGLVGDTWAAVLSGAAELSTWLGLLRTVGDETDPDVWSAVLGPLGLLDLIVTDADRPGWPEAVRPSPGRPSGASAGTRSPGRASASASSAAV